MHITASIIETGTRGGIGMGTGTKWTLPRYTAEFRCVAFAARGPGNWKSFWRGDVFIQWHFVCVAAAWNGVMG